MSDYNAPLPPVESLSLAGVDARPVWIDWTEGWLEEWQAWEAVECESCGHTRVVDPASWYGEEPCDTEHDYEGVPHRCGGGFPYTEGPAIYWAWPITPRPIDLGDAAESLTHLPVCVVEHEEHGALLALTGGGMDLSWELCEAYIRLGLAPPFALCDLPRMAGRGENAHDRHIIEACQRSCEHIIRNAEAVNAHLASSYRKG